ncbi:sigma-54-dependent Fis family transcriptional regulator [Desulfovermiculus halophilus]|uniref:sigma-54-dependent Fis family transcriptional regulator n=1 Tax=Desulfovermiculus halophilus TaxID=339722 RepID=UPI000688EA8A|nr:sigma-54-dependent Fis family transcriptional regulator [Desulfovermiculus halophilus]
MYIEDHARSGMADLEIYKQTIQILRQFKKCLFRAQSEEGFLQELCELIVRTGGYRMAWAGYNLEPDPGPLELVACHGQGTDKDFVRQCLLLDPVGNRHMGPSLRAVETGEPFLVHDIPRMSSMAFSKWKELAMEYGFGAVLSIPLRLQQEMLGVLTVYTDVNQGFDPVVEEVLLELSADIAYGIQSLRTQADHEHAEEVIQRTEAKYRAVLENTGTGTILIENNETVSFVNETFTNLTGYSKQEIVGRMKWSDFVAAKDKQRMQNYHVWRRTVPGKAPSVYQCTVEDKQGRHMNVLMKVGMVENSTMSVASFMDISQATQAQDILSQKESQLNVLLDNFEGFIYVRDTSYRIEYINKRLINRLGRDPRGELCYKALYNKEKPCPGCRHEILGREDFMKREFHSSIDDRWYRAVLSPILNSGGAVSRVQCLLTDITELKEAESDLIEREKKLKKASLSLQSMDGSRFRLGRILGKSQAMQEVYDLILKAAASDDYVLIYGEAGTGKELVAQTIHDLSPRAKNTFLPVNCGAIHENIIESEFFGYKKGAFTGADKHKPGYMDVADQGTLFLDEVGEIPLSMQVKLLRVMDGNGYLPLGGVTTNSSDVRIVAATNRDLQDLVRQGHIRQDFFYRIHVIPIPLPPLRERKEDLPLLIEHFVSSITGQEQSDPLPARVVETLHHYSWPGNVRELQSVIKRTLTMGRFDPEFLDHSNAWQEQSPGIGHDAGQDLLFQQDMDLKQATEAFEKQFIEQALQSNRWSRMHTAEALGIHRKTLHAKMRKYGVE